MKSAIMAMHIGLDFYYIQWKLKSLPVLTWPQSQATLFWEASEWGYSPDCDHLKKTTFDFRQNVLSVFAKL